MQRSSKDHKELDRRNCPACDGSAAKSFGEKNGFSMFECRKCRTIYTDRVPSVDESEDYDQYYHQENLKVPDFVFDRLVEIFGDFERYKKSKRMLDIGCGAGLTLDAAKECGWTPYGLEVSEPAVINAKKKGYEVFHGFLSEAKYPDDHFDLITAVEVLEHLPDPKIELKEIARILRPGGLFWATTPSARAVSYRLLKIDWSVLSPPEHIQLYSAKGAAILLEQAGFSSIKFKTAGVNPFEILNHYRSSRNDINGNDRVKSAYSLNESLNQSTSRKAAKNVINGILSVAGLGDSLKIFATVAE